MYEYIFELSFLTPDSYLKSALPSAYSRIGTLVDQYIMLILSDSLLGMHFGVGIYMLFVGIV